MAVYKTTIIRSNKMPLSQGPIIAELLQIYSDTRVLKDHEILHSNSNYTQLARTEYKGSELKPGDTVAFIGSGPLPLRRLLEASLILKLSEQFHEHLRIRPVPPVNNTVVFLTKQVC